jgi:large subunit ribosomal protein L4
MAAVPTYTKSGTKATKSATLDATVFAVMPQNHELLKQAYTTYMSNGRLNLAVVKTRGLVSGGGRKPWKQKGTGRARFGSSRNPIWRGGGIVFGPTGLENYTKKIHVNAKRTAIRQALSLAANEGQIIVVESFETNGKVKDTAAFLQKIDAKGSVLLVLDNKDDKALRATNNLQKVNLVSASYLNVYDLLNADTVVITQKSLEIINAWLGNQDAKAPAATKEAK